MNKSRGRNKNVEYWLETHVNNREVTVFEESPSQGIPRVISKPPFGNIWNYSYFFRCLLLIRSFSEPKPLHLLWSSMTRPVSCVCDSEMLSGRTFYNSGGKVPIPLTLSFSTLLTDFGESGQTKVLCPPSGPQSGSRR